MLPLRDRVEILRAGVVEDPYSGETTISWTTGVTVQTVLPAQVSYTTTAVVSTPDQPGRNALVEELRAVIPPFDFDPELNRIRWEGTDYTNDGPPMVRRIGGRDHHLTIPMKVVTG